MNVRKRRATRLVKRLDVPVPESEQSPESVLAKALGSDSAADDAMREVETAFDLAPGSPRNVLAAMVLARISSDLAAVARLLGWNEFEDFCASVIAAAGYHVRVNVRLKKPTRQIDIVAESPSMVIAIDCKHWKRTLGEAGLLALAAAQQERTRLLKRYSGSDKDHLPVVLTMLDSEVREVMGVAVVPLGALRDFLASISRFDDNFEFV
ncbi:MAG: NERD domain-containing protein [Thaumarchaeota archaeon]|nr:NERD domain-containing protein [Nitrososphaerota archaeon]